MLTPRYYKMRRYYAVLGTSVFFVAIFSMYLLLDQAASGPGINSQLQEGELSVLEAKLQNLEESLAKNRDTINQIRDTVKSLAEGKNQPVVQMNQQPNQVNIHVPEHRDTAMDYGDAVKYNGVAASVDKDECTFGDTPSGTSADVKMLDVFDLVKFDNPDGGSWKQGFEITYNTQQWEREPLQVFLVPHSHNDPGWIKTFEVYFRDQTQHILNNAVVKLLEDRKRRFIWAEISYFSRWWEAIDMAKKKQVIELISRGQLEIVSGGWVMPDEANTHYYAMLDQMIEGHTWLDAHLGVKPRSGWAIDPFGHSPTMAYLSERAGINAILIQRVHYSIKKYLASVKKLEFMWRQNWDHGSSTDMFCHMMPFYSYDVPHTCGPDPRVCCQFDFKRLPGGRVSCPWKLPPVPITDTNVASKAEILLDQYRKKSQLYKTNVLLIPLGDDFRYDKIIEWDQQFSNYGKLFDYMNSNPRMNVKAQFGTLSEYFDAVWRSTGSEPGSKPNGFPTLGGDFFTYSDREDHYWSGYFTSRPFYKNLDRVLESNLRAAEIVYSLAMATAKRHTIPGFNGLTEMERLVKARRQMGLFQHHDGITGTGKDVVVIDYGQRMLEGINEAKRVIRNSAQFLMMTQKDNYKEEVVFFDLDEKRASHDAMSEKTVISLSDQPTKVVIINSLAQERQEMVLLLVSSSNVEVMDWQGNIVTSQSNLVWTGSDSSLETFFELVFVAELPGLGMRTYSIRDLGTHESPEHSQSRVTILNAGEQDTLVRGSFHVFKESNAYGDFSIENAFISAEFTGTNGLLKSITTKADSKRTSISLDFVMYGTRNTKDKSGAYLFLPDGEAKTITEGLKPVIRLIRGRLLSEVHVTFDHVFHCVRLAKSPGADGTALEISNIVDIRSQKNKEIVMRIKTDIQNIDKSFYTDLNGFQIQRRKTLSKLPLQANVYPMPAMSYIEDGMSRLTLHTAQALGVASLQTGWLDVFLDRKLEQDDNRGLQQGVKDNKRTPNLFKLLLERRGADATQTTSTVPTGYPSLLSHTVSQTLNNPLITLPTLMDADIVTEFAPLTQQLSCDVHLLNLRHLHDMREGESVPGDGALLLLHRLGFDCKYPATTLTCSTNQGQVTLGDLFTEDNVQIEEATVTSLTMMYEKGQVQLSEALYIEPMEIKAYRLKFH
ncbi:alpha-mannosidase 2x-like [Ptychodera flava]|uniref:alpha-mannosidase 2x-like n=1 Tax=Ptychodera flava TaxID=63121 RepID=UPI00396A20FC